MDIWYFKSLVVWFMLIWLNVIWILGKLDIVNFFVLVFIILNCDFMINDELFCFLFIVYDVDKNLLLISL